MKVVMEKEVFDELVRGIRVAAERGQTEEYATHLSRLVQCAGMGGAEEVRVCVDWPKSEKQVSLVAHGTITVGMIDHSDGGWSLHS